MLTKDDIKRNEALAELPDEAVAAIVAVSNRATQDEVNTAVGRIHSEYERDWSAIVGEEKPQGVKAYAWIKETGAKLREAAKGADATELKAQLDQLTTERDELKAAVEGGSKSTAVKAELDKVRGQLEAMQTKYSTDTAQLREAAEASEKAKGELQLNYQFTGALSDLKFRDDVISADARNIIIESAKRKVLSSYNTTFSDDGGVLFHNPETGSVHTNPETGKPYTAAELIARQPGVADILDNGRKVNGTDSQNRTEAKTKTGIIGGFKTQREATEKIIDGLMDQGIPRGPKFQEAFDAAWTDHEVQKLPIQ